MQHRKIQIQSDSGELVSGQAPIIVSASRATDIPAFYAEWFFDRLEKGHVVWQNPLVGSRHSFLLLKLVLSCFGLRILPR